MRSYEIGLFVSLRQNCIRREATALRGGEVGDVQKERVDRQLAEEISKSTNKVDFIHLTNFFFFLSPSGVPALIEHIIGIP